MTRIYYVKEEVGPARTFEVTTGGVPGTVKVVGVMLHDGKNSLYAEAFRDRADAVEQLQLQKGDLVQVQLSSAVRARDTEKGRFYSNNFTIEACMVVCRNSF